MKPAPTASIQRAARKRADFSSSPGIFILAAALFTSALPFQCPAANALVGWGDDSHHQTEIPSGLTNSIQVAGGTFHSLALDDSGNVTGWGNITDAATHPPSDLSNAVAVTAGSGFSMALKLDGTVEVWGNQSTPPAGATNVVRIAGFSNTAMALTKDGDVITWGSSTATPPGATNVVAIAAGGSFCVALRGDGTVLGWGNDTLGNTVIPAAASNVVALAAGKYHSLALRSDGTVVGWGDNSYGQSAVPVGLSNVVAIAAGALHSLALQQDGTIVAWGDNTYNQASVPSRALESVAIAAGGYHSLAIVGDGSPAIAVQPVSRYDFQHQEARFQVMASGLQPLTYQWLRNGTDIPNATNSILILQGQNIADSGYYSVVVSNSEGTITSQSVALPPAWRPPLFKVQPQDQTVLCNETARFTPETESTPPLSFQWLFQGTAIQNATNADLVISPAVGENAGDYSLVMTNAYGSATSQVAVLTVEGQPPLITSPLLAEGKQGTPFTYTITGLHDPMSFNAGGLPAGLSVNPTNGVIDGTPLESGMFDAQIGTANLCASATTNLMLVITSSVPVITSPLAVSGNELAPFTYQITATENPTNFGAQNLPDGLDVDPASGLISGTPLYAGTFDVIISASNSWGTGTNVLEITLGNATIGGLSIANVSTNYSSPYLLDFQFSLRDDNDPALGESVAVDPRLLSVQAYEDDIAVSPLETAVTIQKGSSKLLKAFLVLDFTESIASLSNGDTNQNGIADTVEAEVEGAKKFVNQQSETTQIGVYEFHREDTAPQQVIALTSDKTQVNAAIGGIWTNLVDNFPASSRCWDALMSAIQDLGNTNQYEQHYVIFISDGRDESSTATADDVITAATNANVQVYCIGFGAELDPGPLQAITAATSGRYYEATNAADLALDLGKIGKDLNSQYILRWATLKRSATAFMPSFSVFYQGFIAFSPSNPPPVITGTNYVVDTNSTPPETNLDFVYTTNYIIPPYVPQDYAGDPTVGFLRLEPDADIHPTGLTLWARYVPRHISELRIHYRANWPCSVALESTNPGEILYGWTLTETNDGTNGIWATLNSPTNGLISETEIPFATRGPILTFSFRDELNTSNAFSVFDVDNSVYTNLGAPSPSFVMEDTNSFLKSYPALPYNTPVPWLIENGFTNDFVAAETNDPDGDGVPTWQEYIAGTDPRDAESRFQIISLAPTGQFGRYEVTFSTALNRFYRLEASDDLANWIEVAGGISGTGMPVAITDLRSRFGVIHTYYRVIVY